MPSEKWASDGQQDETTQMYGQDGDMGDLSDREEKPQMSTQAAKADKWKTFRVRTMSTVAIIAIFLAMVMAGHVPLMLLVVALQVSCVREFFAIARIAQADRRLPGFRAQQWFFFVIAEFFLLGRFIKANLLVEVTSARFLARCFTWLLRRHNLVSYSLYMAGFVWFVLGLQKRMYLYQFSQFAWTHTIILLVVVPSSFIVSNLFEGIIWYLLPSLLVVANDICAYLAGIFFGRTPLIKLSPKKTVEGFVGGAVGTMLLAFILVPIMSTSDWLTCPRRDLSLWGPLHCDHDELYSPRPYTWRDLDEFVPDALIEQLPAVLGRLPPAARDKLVNLSFAARPAQIHAIVMALFASLIAPFGGFAASGFKRAFKLKDFGDTIPGHGGITDRFDCQVIMALFVYVYYWTYISKPELSVGDVLGSAMKLTNAQQMELFSKLGNLLVGEGLLPGKVLSVLDTIMSGQGNHWATASVETAHAATQHSEL